MSNDTWARYKESQQLGEALSKINKSSESFINKHIKAIEKMKKLDEETKHSSSQPRDRTSQRTRSTVYQHDDFSKPPKTARSRRRHSIAVEYGDNDPSTGRSDLSSYLNIAEVQELFHIRVTCSPTKSSAMLPSTSNVVKNTTKELANKLARRSMVSGNVRLARLKIEELSNETNVMKGSASR
jgi:hypothetical protein